MTDSVFDDDLVQPFQIDAPGLRGRLVRLGPLVDEVLRRHDYPRPVAELLGETLALAATLAAALKFDGVFTLQTKGDGPIRLMVVDVTSDGHMRGYAQFDHERLMSAQQGPIEAPVPRLLGAGYLAFTVDQGPDTERYQGIVELIGATLADCAHHYFRQSEQLQAGIRLACGLMPGDDGTMRWRAGALMLQRLPDEGGHAVLESSRADSAEDDWRRSLIMMGSSRSDELLDAKLSPSDLLFRLFHEDGVRIYPVHRLTAQCRCSLQRVTGMLKSLPRDEVQSLKIDDAVVVTCEFCSAEYRFDDDDLAGIYQK
jgi:molecular chaperone Hsp33